MSVKKVLAIYYSQSGQLKDIIDHLIEPLTTAGISVEKVAIKPINDYPFPWTSSNFYDVMPDCVLGLPIPLMPINLNEKNYDLIILGYQSWFLSPGIPTYSLLNDTSFLSLLKNTPVITITGARNMWLNAFVKVKHILLNNGANIVGNIALADKHMNQLSYITIFHWLLGGKKTKYLGVFPKPGVSEKDIKNTKTFGEIILQHLKNDSWDGLQESLVAKNAVAFKYSLMVLESKASPQYIVWANKINKSKNRSRLLVIFKYYLHVALYVGAPILLLLDALFIKPFSSAAIEEKKKYYLKLN